MKNVLLGTRNATRKEYVKEIVKYLPVHVVSLDDLEIEIKAVEDGKNPIENSLKKTLTYYRQSNMPTLSIDSGLFIDKFPAHKHVETVVLLSHKKADTHINVNVEFGDEEGQIPINRIARNAEESRVNKKSILWKCLW